MRIVITLLVCFVSITIGAGRATGQIDNLNMRETPDGFTGEYVSGKQKVFVEYRSSDSKTYVSRILNSTGQTLVEAVRVPGSITVKLGDVILTVNMNKNDPGKSSVTELSVGDRLKMEEFGSSDVASLVRKALGTIIRERRSNGKDDLMGFLTISMLLDDGSVSTAQQPNRGCDTAKVVYASYKVPNSRVATTPIFMASYKSPLDDCYGCCGPGCYGCSGCYTGACAAHDGCIAVHGTWHPTCMVLFGAAVSSMCSQCGIGCLND
jgi:hypothetical protein